MGVLTEKLRWSGCGHHTSYVSQKACHGREKGVCRTPIVQREGAVDGKCLLCQQNVQKAAEIEDLVEKICAMVGPRKLKSDRMKQMASSKKNVKASGTASPKPKADAKTSGPSGNETPTSTRRKRVSWGSDSKGTGTNHVESFRRPSKPSSPVVIEKHDPKNLAEGSKRLVRHKKGKRTPKAQGEEVKFKDERTEENVEATS